MEPTETINFSRDRLYCAPLGGQNEVGQALWIIRYAGRILLVDAGAVYPPADLPGVDLVLPNLSFLENNQQAILALLLTNGHEEHSGAIAHLLQHIGIPTIMAPEFVMACVEQNVRSLQSGTRCETINIGNSYNIGPFQVEWIRVNDAIADACALYISTPAGNLLYTSSFKLDQTPVDGKLLDLGRIAQLGDAGLSLLISDSAGIEKPGYTPSERSLVPGLETQIANAAARVLVLMSGTNTHRLQLIFDIALKLGRKVILYGDALVQTAVAAVATNNLNYNRKIEAALDQLSALPDSEVLVVATGVYGDPMELMNELAHDFHHDLRLKAGDTIIYSAGINLGSSRRMAMMLDECLARGVAVKYGALHHVHVSKHAGQQELKLMLSVARPRFFLPALGESRHIAHHAQMAVEWGMPPDAIFPLRNGDVLELKAKTASVIGAIESKPAYYNRDQDENVTMRSVYERKNLSLEGVVTIACVLDSCGKLTAEPVVEGSAAGFLQSLEWVALKGDLKTLVSNTVQTYGEKQKESRKQEFDKLRDDIREQANKFVRGRLMARPLVQVMIESV